MPHDTRRAIPCHEVSMAERRLYFVADGLRERVLAYIERYEREHRVTLTIPQACRALIMLALDAAGVP